MCQYCDIKIQISALWGIIVNPRQTLRRPPSDKFYFMSLIISIFIIISRLFSLKNPEDLPMSELIPSILLLIIWFIAFFFLISFVVKVVANLFGKVITYKRAMNIVGYCQMPRVLFIVPISIIALTVPATREPNVFNKSFNLIALLITIYSFALITYGVKLSQRAEEQRNG
jgi:uncharacterized membrane protein